MSQNTVFLSYRRDEAGKHFARSIKLSLERRGYQVFLDVDNLEAGKWAEQLRREVPARAHFLLLLTPAALDRCEDPADWVRQEFELAVQHERNVVPVRVDGFPLDRATIPAAMHGVLEFHALTVYHDRFDASIDELAQRYLPSDQKQVAVGGWAGDRQRIAPSRLPRGAAQLFGRDAELAALDRAWSEGKLNVVTLVAWGGVGKSALVSAWVAKLATRGHHGASYFDWSFYSQGTRDEGAASSEVFVNAALRFFGDEQLAASPASAWDKGAKLAQLVAAHRTVLVLDGLEPLQYPPGPLAGELKDPGLTALLKGLAGNNAGLCVVTTRASVKDLASFHSTTALEWKLEYLSKQSGTALLEALGVHGATKDLEDLVEEVRGHALTLNLLGGYLHRAHGGDVRRRDRVRFTDADAVEQGGHAFRVIAAYERWLVPKLSLRSAWQLWASKEARANRREGQRQLAILRLLGLFDRPASPGCLEALRRRPAIRHLTESIVDLSDEHWRVSLSRLVDAQLVSVAGSGGFPAGGSDSGVDRRETSQEGFDSHPLLREYFGRELRQRHVASWRKAHNRLYEHLRDTTEHQPETLEGLQPLYQAVAHGCYAGRFEEARVEVYRDRILRWAGPGGFYSTDKLGASGADLGAISCFFEERWGRLSPVSEPAQSWLLNEAATRLCALGRLREAMEPMQASLEKDERRKAWLGAAQSATNLSELLEKLGALEESEKLGRGAVLYADRTKDVAQRLMKRATLAWALFQQGRAKEAGVLYAESELLQRENQPTFPQLYSLRGFQYCEWMLRGAERSTWTGRRVEEVAQELLVCSEVERRAGLALDLVMRGSRRLSDIALNHLSLGRARLYRALLSGGNVELSSSEVASAVEFLRAAGKKDYLPLGLLTRAHLRWHEGAVSGARADLDEAWEIASRGPMPLFQADVLLYRARLFRDPAALREARVLIERHGYGRRLGELEDAEAAAASWPAG